MKFQKQYVRSVEGISRWIEIFNKSILKFLDDSIDSWFLFDRSKGTSDRSKGILDQSKNWRNSSQSFWMTQSILDSCSIDRKEHLIDRREFLIYQNSWNWIFSYFSSNRFWRFTLTKHSSLIISEWDWDKKLNFIDAIVLKFNMAWLKSNLNNIIISISVLSNKSSKTKMQKKLLQNFQNHETTCLWF